MEKRHASPFTACRFSTKFAIIHTTPLANEEVSPMHPFRFRRYHGLLLLLLAAFSILCAACGGTSTSSSSPIKQSSLQRSLSTSDGKFNLELTITPDQQGNNTFTVTVKDAKSGQPISNAQVQLFTTMLDMAMGTDNAQLQSSGNGQYTTQGQLSMAGNWQIGIQIRTSDSQVHKAQIKIATSS
jgi:hypothetical protein